MTTLVSEFYNAAKIRNLSPEEAKAILHLAEELGIDPTRVLVNKTLFDQIENAAKKKPGYDEQFFNTIKDKLELESHVTQPVNSTKELKKGQKAKFYFEDKKYVPITLYKNFDDYGLWKVGLHRDMNRLKPGVDGTIIFEQRALIAYKFPAQITENIRYDDETLIKIPHTSNLTVLARRKYPRVETDFDGLVRRVGPLRDNPFYRCTICNISEGGVKICLDSRIFNIKEKVIVRFKLGYEDIEVESSVEAEITYDGEGEYGLKFLSLDDKSRFLIRKYVNSHLQSEGY